MNTSLYYWETCEQLLWSEQVSTKLKLRGFIASIVIVLGTLVIAWETAQLGSWLAVKQSGSYYSQCKVTTSCRQAGML